MAPPPRILILDNDETTGSYNLLFHLYDLFATTDFGKHLDPATTLSVITRHALGAGVFRKGLQHLLQCAATLKSDGRIDKIVMYTNQLDVRHVRGMPIWRTQGVEWSVPLMLQIMLVYLADDPGLIDVILTRPISGSDSGARTEYPVKDLTRAFKAVYPSRPVDLRKTVFLDDLADETTIIDSSMSHTDTHSRMRLPAYSIRLSPQTFRRIVYSVINENGLVVSEGDKERIYAQETLWLEDNSRIADKNVDDRIDQAIPVLKHIFCKRT